MTVKTLNKIGRITAFFSFLIGTGIFILWEITWDLDIAAFGFLYIPIAFFINFLLLILVILKAVEQSKSEKSLMKTGVLMLLNLPIAVLYCWLFFNGF